MELDAEIFAVGKWNGMDFTLDDLKGIADTFNKLKPVQDVALKLGHNNKQAMTDGHPALGWVDKVWVAGEKLMAHYTDVPKIMYDAIKKKLYKNVSVEMDVDVSHQGNAYPYVLTGVALLGADIPAVNTLQDLTHYMSRSAAFSTGRKAVFSAIAGQQSLGGNMELAELTKQVAALTAQVATFTTEKSTMTAENAELKAKVLKFEAEAKAAAEASAKAAIAAKRAEVTGILEDGVKSEGITPAQRGQYSKMLRIDDDVAVMAIDINDVKALVPAGSKKFGKEQGKQGAGAIDLPIDQQVVNECNAMLAKKEASTFLEAQTLLFTRNPKLAREYADFNDKE